MGDKRLDQLSAGVFECQGATEVGGVRLDQGGIEVVLADEHTQPVSQLGLPVTRTIRVRRFYGLGLFPGRTRRVSQPAQLMERTEPDSVSLTKSPIDGSRLSHSHLRATNQRRSICGVGVAIADKPPRFTGLVHRCLEDPATGSDIRKAFL